MQVTLLLLWHVFVSFLLLDILIIDIFIVNSQIIFDVGLYGKRLLLFFFLYIFSLSKKLESWLVFQCIHCLVDFKQVPVIKVSCWLQATVIYGLLLKIICHDCLGKQKYLCAFTLASIYLGQMDKSLLPIAWPLFSILLVILNKENKEIGKWCLSLQWCTLTEVHSFFIFWSPGLSAHNMANWFYLLLILCVCRFMRRFCLKKVDIFWITITSLLL